MKIEENQQEKINKHYLELGMMQGKRKFNSISFVEGFAIGFILGVIATLL